MLDCEILKDKLDCWLMAYLQALGGEVLGLGLWLSWISVDHLHAEISAC